MKSFVITGMLCAGAVLALPDTALAHGGQYRGPGDVVPPRTGGGGGRTPGPGGPNTPGPVGPNTPGPSKPASPGGGGPGTGGGGPGGVGGPGTGGGVELAPDLSAWQFWWEFNKDPFINLKHAVHAGEVVSHGDEFFMGPGLRHDAKDTQRPTDAMVRGRILPMLKRALDGTSQRDITSSCMVAMAKIGKDGDSFDILPLMRERLTSANQEIRETAALAMGISAMPGAVDDLIALAADDAAGRRLVARAEVDDRTRSFAAYGLGLIGHASSNLDVKARILVALESVLAQEDLPGRRNIKTAAIHAIGLLRPDPAESKGRELLERALAALESYFDEPLGPGEELIQAHVPPAIAKLLEGAADAGVGGLVERYQREFLDELEGRRTKKTADAIVQSAAVALGRLGRPAGDDPSAGRTDVETVDALLRYYRQGKDQQAGFFALMALGQIGGDRCRGELLVALEQGSKALEKPWAALSLGVLAFRAREDGGEVDHRIGTELHKWLRRIKNPETQAALAIAMGLAGYGDAAAEVRELLVSNQHQDELAGYLAVALALMNDTASKQTISDIAAASVRRPSRLQQCAIALGKLGDKGAADMLTRMLVDDEQPSLAKMSAIASALGFIGDRRTIEPLIRMLFDEDLADLSRAFAAVALGGIADKELLPWNSKIAANMNYRAAVETLTNRVDGILDIL